VDLKHEPTCSRPNPEEGRKKGGGKKRGGGKKKTLTPNKSGEKKRLLPLSPNLLDVRGCIAQEAREKVAPALWAKRDGGGGGEKKKGFHPPNLSFLFDFHLFQKREKQEKEKKDSVRPRFSNCRRGHVARRQEILPKKEGKEKREREKISSTINSIFSYSFFFGRKERKKRKGTFQSSRHVVWKMIVFSQPVNRGRGVPLAVLQPACGKSVFSHQGGEKKKEREGREANPSAPNLSQTAVLHAVNCSSRL